MITGSEESLVDYEVSARIATEAFGSKEVLFSAERIKWLNERSFGQGTTIVSVSDEGVSCLLQPPSPLRWRDQP